MWAAPHPARTTAKFFAPLWRIASPHALRRQKSAQMIIFFFVSCIQQGNQKCTGSGRNVSLIDFLFSIRHQKTASKTTNEASGTASCRQASALPQCHQKFHTSRRNRRKSRKTTISPKQSALKHRLHSRVFSVRRTSRCSQNQLNDPLCGGKKTCHPFWCKSSFSNKPRPSTPW